MLFSLIPLLYYLTFGKTEEISFKLLVSEVKLISLQTFNMIYSKYIAESTDDASDESTDDATQTNSLESIRDTPSQNRTLWRVGWLRLRCINKSFARTRETRTTDTRQSVLVRHGNSYGNVAHARASRGLKIKCSRNRSR